MRLTCPNCTAQYEVDDSVIPEGGRDVQCSACGHTWFQYPADAGRGLIGTGLLRADHQRAHIADPAPAAREPAQADPAAADPAGPADPAPIPRRPVAPPPALENDDEDDDGFDADSETVSPSRPVGAAVPPRRVEQGVLDMLREEADREIRERQRGRDAALETQTELGLEAPQTPSQTSSQAVAQTLRTPAGAVPEATPEPRVALRRPEGARVPRRNLLPDIEELSSTLEPVDYGRGSEDEGRTALPPDRGRDFRRGISLVLLVATTLTALYVLAPALAEAVPALAMPLEGYVSLVDALRLWVAQLLTGR